MNNSIFWDDGIIIKPCPCCGGEPDIKDNGYMEPEIDPATGAYVGMDIEEPDFYWVVCKSCGLSSVEKETPEETIALWNKRVDSDD